jgi:hypothetical protein
LNTTSLEDAFRDPSLGGEVNDSLKANCDGNGDGDDEDDRP